MISLQTQLLFSLEVHPCRKSAPSRWPIMSERYGWCIVFLSFFFNFRTHRQGLKLQEDWTFYQSITRTRITLLSVWNKEPPFPWQSTGAAMLPWDTTGKFSSFKYLLGPAAVTYLMLSSLDTKIGPKISCSKNLLLIEGFNLKSTESNNRQNSLLYMYFITSLRLRRTRGQTGERSF